MAVFGASGQTGTTLVVQALLHGELSVRALIRNPDKLRSNLSREAPQLKQENNERLEIIEVKDVFDADSIAPHLQGVDVVVSTLGFPVERPSTNYMRSSKAILDAMKQSGEGGPRRYIGMHSWYSDPPSRAKCPFYLRYTLLAYIAPVLDDMRNVERYVETETTDIDYTFVLPAGLQNKPMTDLEFKVAESSWCVEGAGSMIARADVARFIIKVIKEDTHKKKIVAIAT